MEARELLLLLISFAGAAIRGALFAQPPNVTYLIDKESCHLEVGWQPPEPPSSNCTRAYMVGVRVDGIWNTELCSAKTSGKVNVPLGKNIAFGIQTSCKGCTDLPWNDDEAFHVVQSGSAGTRARDVNCTWWNRNYMECLWRAGEKASPGSSYNLSYWYNNMDKGQPCIGVTHDGSVFRCVFELSIQHLSLIAISIQGNSGHIQPLCLLWESINSLVKFDPPVITHLSKNGSKVFLNWTEYAFSDFRCEVEVVSEQKPEYFQYFVVSAEISLNPNVRHTFRVRCSLNDGQWSEWSKREFLDGTASAFPLLLLVLIPLSAALLLIIFLIYLKSIKLLILQKIPDPEKILRRMFEEQNENQPTHETASNEETHSFMIVEPAGNEK